MKFLIKLNCGYVLVFLSLLLYDIKTEFKIKWLVNLLAFSSALLFLLWMNSCF